MTSKHDLRLSLLEARHRIGVDDRSFWNQLIFERMHKLRVFQRAHTIHVYRNTESEVATDSLIEYAWATGKRVVVPVVNAEVPGSLLHASVTRTTTWEKGALGIEEPTDRSEMHLVNIPELGVGTCIIVPVVGFDTLCNRLGYGKGMYDRFLQSCQGTPAVGIAYELQRVSNGIPVEHHDLPLAAVVTEVRTYLP